MPAAPALATKTCVAGAKGEVIPVDIAAAKALSVASPVAGTQRVPLMAAAGRVTAAAILAGIDLPPFDNSAMDGYAVRSAEFTGDGPWRLAVGDRIAAGDAVLPRAAASGAAIRILTGAPVPLGFDAVVMQEHCSRQGGSVTIVRPPRRNENIRLAGEDIRAGSMVLPAGVELTPQRLAVLAGQGAALVDVVRKVRIGLISTGSELRNPGEPLAPGQIYNSNRLMIRSAIARHAWAEIVDFGIVPDRRHQLVATFADAVQRCDVLITTGGVSSGDEDHVVSALEHHGGVLDVLKIAMRPGKPVKIGMIEGAMFAGLPGNPNAAFVTFHQIAFPAIRRIAGIREVTNRRTPAVAGFSYEKRVGRTEFVTVKVIGRDAIGLPILDLLGRGSSANLMAIALADGLAMLPPEIGRIDHGAFIAFDPFDSC